MLKQRPIPRELMTAVVTVKFQRFGSPSSLGAESLVESLHAAMAAKGTTRFVRRSNLLVEKGYRRETGEIL